MLIVYQQLNISHRLRTVGLLVMLGVATAGAASAQSILPGTREVVSVREFPLNPGVDEAEFEAFVREKFNPTLERAIPGIKAYIAKADRGLGTGRYAYIIIFDSWNTRYAYIPEEGQVADWFRERFYTPLRPLYDELWKYADRSAWANFTDYVELR